MQLIEMLEATPEIFRDRSVAQIIAFAADGKFRDGNECSLDFRAYLDRASSQLLLKYADDCLTSKFEDSGSALQDVLNEVGRRLGFTVQNGRYRGVVNQIGFDGLWITPDGHSIVVESKTTDAYRIDLGVVTGYRRSLVANHEIAEERSSVLIVVGRQDTGDLEAQIRGSKHAWDIRLVSLDALMRLMLIKESVEDPTILGKVQSVLLPREYTRIDGIIDLVFSTAEDVREEEFLSDDVDPDDETVSKPRFTPVSFHQQCVDRIQRSLGKQLQKRSRAMYVSPDGLTTVFCAISKAHTSASADVFWYAFHPHQKELLEASEVGFVAFGCGSSETVLLIPRNTFVAWLPNLNMTKKTDRFYWHVKIFKEGQKFVLHPAGGHERVDLTEYLVSGS